MKPKFGEYFLCEEFACPCCGVALMDRDFIIALNRLRALADRPIWVNSGFRCFNHNYAIGGAPGSYHMAGKAADIVIVGLTLNEMLKLAEQVDAFRNGGIGIYPKKGFIHVDNRGRRARWTE